MNDTRNTSTMSSRPLAYDWRTEFGRSFAQRKVLVTGAAGFVGSHLVDAVRTLGADVTATDLTPNGLVGIRAETVDLCCQKDIQRAIDFVRPDIVLHLAGVVNTRHDLHLVRQTFEGNLLSTINLMLALAQTNCRRIVITGSSEEIVTQTRIPSSPYAVSKMALTAYGRMFHQLYGLPVVVARPFLTYGPRQQPHKLIPYTIIELLRQRDPVLRSGERICDFVYVVDLVRGLLRACLEDSIVGEVVELGTGTGVRIADAAEAICKIVGGSGRLAYDGAPQDHIQPRQVARSDERVRLPGWEPLWSLQDGLRETVTWYNDWLCQLSEQSLT